MKRIVPSFITRTIWIVSLVSLFTDVASEMLYPVMPVYLMEIGFSVALIGLLEGMAEAIAGFSKGYFGKLSDAIGKRIPFVRLGYAFSALSKPMMGLLTAPAWIFTARAVDRIGKGVRTGARDALLSAESTRENKARVFGFHRGMDTLGAAIGPLIALLFLAAYPHHYRALFLWAFIPGVLAVFLTLLLREHKKSGNTAKSGPGFFSFIGYWKTAPATYRMLVAGLLAFTLFNSSDAFLLLALKDKGFSDTTLIGFYILYNVCYALLSYPVGALADRIGLRVVMVAGLLIFAVVYGSIGFVQAVGLVAGVFVLYGLYASAVEGVSKALITNIVPSGETATAIGFYTGFGSLMTLLSSTLAGWLWTTVSPQFMFLFSAAGVTGVALYFAVVFWLGKHKHAGVQG
jgi:MFS family permease